MILVERNEKILEYIKERDLCSIQELVENFNISKVTVHRVLNELEQGGSVHKVRGGVKFAGYQVPEDYDIRIQRQVQEKQEIARTAVTFLEEDSSVFMDSSTTTIYMAREIAKSVKFNFTMITDSPVIVCEMFRSKNIQVFSTGGELQHELNTFAGPFAYENMEKFQFEKAFISCAAINPEKGIMTSQYVLVRLVRIILAKAREVNLLIDHSKFIKIAPLVIAPITSVGRIITDSGLSDTLVKEYQEFGVEIVRGRC